MKRILFIIHSLDGGGAEKVLFDILNNFDYSSYEVELLLIKKEGVYLDRLPKQVQVSSLAEGPISFKLAYQCYKLFGWRQPLKKLVTANVKKSQFDTVVSFLEGKTTLVHSFLFERAKRNLSWVHTDFKLNHWSKRSFRANDEQRIYSQMGAVVMVSRDTEKQFNTLFTNVNTKVIYNLIERDKIAQVLTTAKAKPDTAVVTLCSVGRLTKIKAVDRLLQVVKKLQDAGYDVYCNVIGDGVEKSNLLALAEQLKIADRVNFLGFVTAPYEIMAESDIYLSTSTAEGFSLVIAEAFCLGLPVVATKTAGPIELLDNNKYGILVEHEVDAIFVAIKRLIEDKELRQHYSEMALQRSQIFDVSKTMAEIYDIL